jgi:hypothetical protein
MTATAIDPDAADGWKELVIRYDYRGQLVGILLDY